MASVLLLGTTALLGILLATPRGPAAQPSDRLAMAAQASGRPKECRKGGERSRQARWTIWDHARQPDLLRYCDLLGRGHALLDRSPASAREAASLADQVLPGKAAPLVLTGRAHVRLRDFDRALQDFRKARAIDPRSLEEPGALHDLAITQKHTGALEDAAATYRILVPRLDLLPDMDDRVAVLLEAAALAMNRSTPGLDEATALLSQARAMPLSKHSPLVLGLLALALDRASSPEQADAVLDTLHRSNGAAVIATLDPASLSFLANPADWNAVLAITLEREDRARAITTWERYVAGKPPEPHVAHAKARIDALRKASVRP